MWLLMSDLHTKLSLQELHCLRSPPSSLTLTSLAHLLPENTTNKNTKTSYLDKDYKGGFVVWQLFSLPQCGSKSFL